MDCSEFMSFHKIGNSGSRDTSSTVQAKICWPTFFVAVQRDRLSGVCLVASGYSILLCDCSLGYSLFTEKIKFFVYC
jgi:hypothetical protein